MLALNWNIVWTFVNLLVFYLLLKKFLFGPVNAIIEKRQMEIGRTIQYADDRKKEADALKQSYEQAIADAQKEADQIVINAKMRAEKEYETNMEIAKKDVQQKWKEAQENITSEREKAIREISSQIADIALLAAGKVAQEDMTQDKNKKLVDAFLTEAGVRQ